MDRKNFIEELITTIEHEINCSSSTQYVCENGNVISIDVGYVEEWFDKYKEILRKRYY